MKHIPIVPAILLAAFLQLPASVSYAADSSQHVAKQAAKDTAMTKEVFIDNMAEQVTNVLKNDKKSFAEKQAALRSMFAEVVDTDWIAKFVLGKAWKEATPQQKEKYTELYRTYLTETYVSKFDEESGSKVKDIKVKGIKEASGDTFSAHTEIVQSGTEPPVKVDYLLRQKEGQFKVIDITIEGISLLATHRQQFSALANANGIDAVITKLTEFTTHKA